MTFKTLLTASAFSVAAFFGLSPAAQAFDDAERKEIGEIVRQYLLENPGVMIEVQQALEKKQTELRMAQAKQAVAENHDEIFQSSHDLALGNPNGKITVVEFFDYNCGYCKRALSDMDAIIQANPEVRFVLKEFPILGPDSLAAHKVSDAFKRIAPEKYGDFHRQLLGSEGHADEARAVEIAVALGVSEEALREQMAKGQDQESVQEAYKLATRLGISGTPSYVIGDEAIFGAVGADTLSEKVKNVSQCGKTAC